MQLFADLRKQEQEEVRQAELVAKALRVDELEAAEADRKAKATPERQPARRLPIHGETEPEALSDPSLGGAPTIRVASKYDRLSISDMAAVAVQMIAKKVPLSPEWGKAWADKVVRENVPVPAGIKTDELDNTAQSGFGLEWVNTIWSNTIWERARKENVVLPLIETFTMPTSPFTQTIESTDPTVYFTPETTDEAQLVNTSGNATPISKIGTGNKTWTAKKLSLRVGWSTEQVEDSAIDVVSQFQKQATRAMADALDNVLINGDTETGATGNINSDDEAPTATDKFLIFNGFRKNALVTNTANAVDANGTPTLALFQQTRATMAGDLAYLPEGLAWIVDFQTYMKLLPLPEFITMDKAGELATNLRGQLGIIDGIPLFCSGQMGLTEADGKISFDTPANNVKGQAVLIYRRYWSLGTVRQLSVIAERKGQFDAWIMWAHMRQDLVSFSTDASSVLFNITV